MANTVIFDFDGTIADSLALTIEVFRELTGWNGARTPEEVARFRRMPIAKVVKEVKVPLYQVPSLMVRGRKIMASRITGVPIFAGMPEVVKALHRQGHGLLVMSSNSQQNVKQFLRFHHLDDYFEAVYGGIGLLNKAAALRRVIRLHHIDRQNCIYIGDEQRDVDGANRAHIKVIAVAWGYNDAELLKAHKPFAIAKEPADILGIIKAKVL